MDDKNKQAESQDALDKPAEPELNSLEQLSEGNDKQPDAPDAAGTTGVPPAEAPKPKKKGLKRLFGFFNVYLLAFIFVLLIGGAVFTVYYLNSKKVPPTPEIAVEDLSEETLNEIASEGEATIGDSDLLLNIQSNAVFNGQILAKGDVNIAGRLQLGSGLSVPSLTVSGSSNLGSAQVNQLAVANSMVVQGSLTVQQGLNIGGTATFNGAVTAGRITTSNLTLSGTGALELNNHIIVNGPNPGRSVGSAVGVGGSASVSGSDTAGRVNINTGQTGAAGCLITINFTQRYGSTPNVLVSPSSAGAALTAYYTSATATNFSICAAQTPPAGTTLDFQYFVVE